MLIFVEGIDKSGKSTFIEHMRVCSALPVYRKQPPSLSLADHHNYFKGIGYALVELHNLLTFDLIVDRSFISDWIYTNKSCSQRDISLWMDWEQRQKTIQESLIVYLQISEEVFVKRITVSPDEYMSPEDYPRCVELYEEYFRHTSLPVVRISGVAPAAVQTRQLVQWAAGYPQQRLGTKILRYFDPLSEEEVVQTT